MKTSLQNRVVSAYKEMDKLDRLRSLYEDTQGTSPQALVATAAIVGAEILATAMGKGDHTALIHRAYEEITQAMAKSPAIHEVFSDIRTASKDKESVGIQELVTEFRIKLAGYVHD